VFLPLCHVAERVGGYYTSLALGSVMNFRRKPGNGARQSPRGAADGVSGGAANLGEVLFRRDHRAEGCHPVPELDVPPRHGGRLIA